MSSTTRFTPFARKCRNGDDDNCDGETDEGEAVGAISWYADADGDGYGDPTTIILACSAPDTFVENSDDCMDEDAAVHPDAREIWYDSIDSDCAGDSDFDADHDAYDSAKYGGADCDDARADTFPGAADAPMAPGDDA